MKASHSHFFELAVDRLDGAAMVRRSNSAQPVEGCLLDRTCATGQTPDSVRIAAASKRADAGLVPQQRSSCRQSLRQLMNGGQIVQRSWQKCEVHRFTSQRTDPMQAPTKELLLLLFYSAIVATFFIIHVFIRYPLGQSPNFHSLHSIRYTCKQG
jgi:hypothetical protein